MDVQNLLAFRATPYVRSYTLSQALCMSGIMRSYPEAFQLKNITQAQEFYIFWTLNTTTSTISTL